MAMGFKAKIEGKSGYFDGPEKMLIKELTRVQKEFPKVVDNALKIEALKLEAEAIELTPHAAIKGGNLRKSSELKQIPGGWSVGFYAWYAVYVHEMTDPNVNWTKPGTGPKFLQAPFEKRIKGLPDRLLKSIMKLLERLK